MGVGACLAKGLEAFLLPNGAGGVLLAGAAPVAKGLEALRAPRGVAAAADRGRANMLGGPLPMGVVPLRPPPARRIAAAFLSNDGTGRDGGCDFLPPPPPPPPPLPLPLPPLLPLLLLLPLPFAPGRRPGWCCRLCLRWTLNPEPRAPELRLPGVRSGGDCGVELPWPMRSWPAGGRPEVLLLEG